MWICDTRNDNGHGQMHLFGEQDALHSVELFCTCLLRRGHQSTKLIPIFKKAQLSQNNKQCKPSQRTPSFHTSIATHWTSSPRKHKTYSDNTHLNQKTNQSSSTSKHPLSPKQNIKTDHCTPLATQLEIPHIPKKVQAPKKNHHITTSQQ